MKHFRNLIIILTFSFLSISCNPNGWTKEEKTLINDDSMVMRVLSVDDSADLVVLRQQSTLLPEKYIAGRDYQRLAEKLVATVTDPSQDGVGIAGPQVGISRRIVAVQRFDKEGEPFEVYPNIRITEMRGELVSGAEGCLSVPGRRGDVCRSRDISITYTSPYSLKDTTEIVQDFTAVIFQHECDHLDGVIYTDRIWSSETSWYKCSREVNEDFVDVFYISATVVISQKNDEGVEIYNAILDSTAIAGFNYEMNKASETVFNDSLNFFSPYYHQATMNAYKSSGQILSDAIEKARLEIIDAFDYYMANVNNGRRFILAGFSQGANLSMELLKHMSDEQYSRLVAAYVIGYGVSEDNSKNPHIIPASGATDTGVTISFNTVADTSGIYYEVYENTVACINPVNWNTDSTPAEFIYKDNSLNVYIDTTKRVLIVKDFRAKETPFTPFFPEGCLHSWDLSFYAPYLGENAKVRSYHN